MLQTYHHYDSVCKIEHFYSMGNPASQGKIYCMLYACLRLQLCDLKRKKPIRMDGLFNLLDSLKISSLLL
jgi:hypothetical protein